MQMLMNRSYESYWQSRVMASTIRLDYLIATIEKNDYTLLILHMVLLTVGIRKAATDWIIPSTQALY